MLESIIIISLVCTAVHALTRDDMLFGWWQKVCCDERENVRSELFEPLTECLTCMSSFWTCCFLGVSGNVPVLYFVTFIIGVCICLLSSFYLDGDAPKTFYILFVVTLVLNSISPLLSITIMLGVCGFNFIIDNVVNFDDSYQIGDEA